jgi:integrase
VRRQVDDEGGLISNPLQPRSNLIDVQHAGGWASISIVARQDRPGNKPDAPLFLASRKNGELVDAAVKLGRSPDKLELRGQPFNARSIQKRVRLLGKAVGLQSLSPHDCRHCWTTRAPQAKSNLTHVQHAGGWSSIVMVAHYANQAAIANEGIRLTRAAVPDKE